MPSNLQEPFYPGCKPINPKYCETCIFAYGNPPFADLPQKRYCMIYTRENGARKPNEVYYDGKTCEFYEEDTEK